MPPPATARRETTLPDAALIAYETELEALVIEWRSLDDAGPKGRTAMARREFGRRHEECLERVDEL